MIHVGSLLFFDHDLHPALLTFTTVSPVLSCGFACLATMAIIIFLSAVSSISRHNRTPAAYKGTARRYSPFSIAILHCITLPSFLPSPCSLNVSCPRLSKCIPALPITLALSVVERLHNGVDGAKPLGTALPNTCVLCVCLSIGVPLSDYRATHRTGSGTVKCVALSDVRGLA
jgi:hypothetical protein